MPTLARDHDRPGQGLPNFDRPPVIELVLGVQFEPLPMMAQHIGLFWSEVRARFPKVQQQGALEPVIERFGVKGTLPPGGGAGFKVMDVPETPRCWFLDESGTQLIQVQPDRLLHNWRKVGELDKYPRYETIRAAFLEELERFNSFVTREGLGTLKPNQCEVTYINNIRPSGVWETFGQADRVFRVWAPTTGGSLRTPEDVRFAVRYIIDDDEGRPLGRLHVNAQPAYVRKDSSEVFALNLTARGAPEGEGIKGVMGFLDRGHRCIVLGFTDLTTEPMHQAWGKHGS